MEAEVAVEEVAVEEVAVRLKRHVMVVMVYTCWAVVVRSSPSMETGAPIPASVPLYGDIDYTVAPQQGSVEWSNSKIARQHLHLPVLRSLVAPRH